MATQIVLDTFPRIGYKASIHSNHEEMMAKATNQAMIDGLPVRDLVKPIKLIISAADCANGNKRKPGACAAALAAKRLPEISEARIHIGRVFLKFKNKYWLRGKTPGSLRTEIVSFDRGGKFEPGEYMIRPLPPSEMPTGKTMGSFNNHQKKTKRVTTKRKLRILQSIRNNAHAEYKYGSKKK